jgi:hypothetical protein
MLCLFLLLFAISPGFGKLNLQNNNTTTNGFNRLTDEKIQNFIKDKYGFELHCPDAPAKETGMHDENRGLVSTEFIE